MYEGRGTNQIGNSTKDNRGTMSMPYHDFFTTVTDKDGLTQSSIRRQIRKQFKSRKRGRVDEKALKMFVKEMVSVPCSGRDRSL